jgi:hypothetical protein
MISGKITMENIIKASCTMSLFKTYCSIYLWLFPLRIFPFKVVCNVIKIPESSECSIQIGTGNQW